MTASGARHVGNIASIITGTVAEVTREIGDWITDAIEMNEAAAAARRDAMEHSDTEAAEAGTSYDEETEPAPPTGTSFVTAEVVEPEIIEPEIVEPGDNR
ncbi:hypothetical protein [Nocardia goodfellowii]|uniref:Uncharacterized protein n=1 Tax=Nocardia goodfellowii TaxID=882446 RepID=A0ABS4QRB7_9NOCA|nr:hypothetical protein [Nocardia goodfellowii]MBP2194257.1 hypothetical protein [Nocardia goodfellowii]